MSFTPMPKDTTIKLCRRVPLSPSYNFTIYQTSRSAQKAMFNSYVTGASTFSSQSYQRAGENKLRIAALADNLYDVNYLFFDNFIAPNTSLKTFYCFVTDVKYINDNTTEITYVVDYMQTYYFDINVPACFVEREHTLSDNMFEHLVPEGLSAGEYNVQATVSVSYPKPDTTVYSANDDNASHMYFLYVPNDKVLDPEGWDVAPPGRITDITDSDVTNSSYAINRGGQVVCCELFYLPIPAITNLTENVSIVIRRLVQIRARIVAVYLVPNKARNYFY